LQRASQWRTRPRPRRAGPVSWRLFAGADESDSLKRFAGPGPRNSPPLPRDFGNGMPSSLAPRFGAGPFLSGGASWYTFARSRPRVVRIRWCRPRVKHGRGLFSRLHLCVSDRKMGRKGDPQVRRRGHEQKKGAARERMPSLRRDRLCRRRAADKDRTLCP
jgi:hypothetical protein